MYFDNITRSVLNYSNVKEIYFTCFKYPRVNKSISHFNRISTQGEKE